MKKFPILIAFALTWSCQVLAETRYISDVLYVPLRSGAGGEYRIINSAIKSGQKLTVLEDTGGEWTKVVTQGGTEGWIRSQYLVTEPPAKLKLGSARDDLARAQTELARVQKQYADLSEEHKKLQNYANSQASERQRFETELKELKALSADAINLNKSYHDLVANKEILETERDSLHAENEQLKKDRTINQWVFGAGLVVLGMILMLILPALKRSKRSSEWAN